MPHVELQLNNDRPRKGPATCNWWPHREKNSEFPFRNLGHRVTWWDMLISSFPTICSMNFHRFKVSLLFFCYQKRQSLHFDRLPNRFIIWKKSHQSNLRCSLCAGIYINSDSIGDGYRVISLNSRVQDKAGIIKWDPFLGDQTWCKYMEIWRDFPLKKVPCLGW